jgi:hypothetical protein
MDYMKRSLVIISMALSMNLIPASGQAASPSAAPIPSPTASAQPSTTSAPSPISTNSKKEARAAARSAYNDAMEQAQNGRDLAFADANATLMQALSTAGKDKFARKAANESYRLSAQSIVRAYKQAIAQAKQTFKATVAALSGK